MKKLTFLTASLILVASSAIAETRLENFPPSPCEGLLSPYDEDCAARCFWSEGYGWRCPA